MILQHTVLEQLVEPVGVPKFSFPQVGVHRILGVLKAIAAIAVVLVDQFVHFSIDPAVR